MKTKYHISTDKTFEIVRSAVNKMVDTISPTYGPAGNKVIIDKAAYRMVVDDGVQIARDFELADPSENAVVKVVREALGKTNDRVGDGTTGSAIMLKAIVNEVAKLPKRDGRMISEDLKRGLENVRKNLRKTSVQIKTKEDLRRVAMVSFDNAEIAEIVADLYFKLGKDAVITIDRSPTMSTTVDRTEGIEVQQGYISPYMINNPDRLEAVLEKPYILLTDYRITENSDLMPIMEKMAKAGAKNLVVIAENVEQQALATLVINQPHVMNPETRKPGSFPSVAMALPGVDDRKSLLEDLATMTGGRVFSVDKGDKLEMAEISDLGRAEKVICGRDTSLIVSPGGKKSAISDNISALRKAIAAETNTKKREVLEYRLARYTNSMAVIRVGAATENEQKALKYKVEDCVNAVRSAYRHGVVCGSGLALARTKTSSQILNKALRYPSRQLFENMGIDLDDTKLPDGHAMNVVTGRVGHFMDVGVMDPVDVLLAGVESAVSIATILVTSTGIIAEERVED